MWSSLWFQPRRFILWWATQEANVLRNLNSTKLITPNYYIIAYLHTHLNMYTYLYLYHVPKSYVLNLTYMYLSIYWNFQQSLVVVYMNYGWLLS